MSTPVSGPLATVPLHVAAGDIAVWWNDPAATWESVPLGSGPAGPQGVPGPAGATGSTGLQGVPGVAGPAGPTGATGGTGATGAASTVPGPTGSTGATGPQGVVGLTGPTGATGAANMSGMVAGQIPIAASPTSVTSSIPTATFLTPAAAASIYAPINNPSFTGTVTTASALNTGAAVGASPAGIEIGNSRTADGIAYLDMHATAGGSDYDFRLIRNTGANGAAQLINTGTGPFQITNPAGIQIQATSTNDSAPAGYYGEYIESQVAQPGVTLSANTATNVTSIALTAGDWIVNGVVYYTAAGGTVEQYFVQGAGNVSATLPVFPYYGQLTVSATGQPYCLPIPERRFLLSAPATIYLIVQAGFTTSTLQASGNIHARRIR